MEIAVIRNFHYRRPHGGLNSKTIRSYRHGSIYFFSYSTVLVQTIHFFCQVEQNSCNSNLYYIYLFLFQLFVDKDTIVNAVSASHDAHTFKIDNKVLMINIRF